MSIALFYAVGTAIGGVVGPVMLGQAVENGNISEIAKHYYLGALLMIVAGLAETSLGVEAARHSLERVAPPLSAARNFVDN